MLVVSLFNRTPDDIVARQWGQLSLETDKTVRFRPVNSEDVAGLETDEILVHGVEPDVARNILVQENNEALVPVPDGIPRLNVYLELSVRPHWDWLRKSVVGRLMRANAELPVGWNLVLLDGYRTLDFQRELMAHYFSKPVDAGVYVSNPSDPELRPPHATGGAVDITLGVSGDALELGTSFDEFTPRASLSFFETLPDCPEKTARRLLASVMTGAGFAPYPSEWWHWSFGDQFWAASFDEPTARFGVIDT